MNLFNGVLTISGRILSDILDYGNRCARLSARTYNN